MRHTKSLPARTSATPDARLDAMIHAVAYVMVHRQMRKKWGGGARARSGRAH